MLSASLRPMLLLDVLSRFDFLKTIAIVLIQWRGGMWSSRR
jgi:hypothetical protein